MKCRVCGAAMVAKYKFASLPPEDKARLVAHGGRGLCRPHYIKDQRYGNPLHVPKVPDRSGPRAPMRSRAEVLEEYELIKDSVGSLAQAAERMGMKTNTLYMALARARREGAAA